MRIIWDHAPATSVHIIKNLDKDTGLEPCNVQNASKKAGIETSPVMKLTARFIIIIPCVLEAVE